MAVYHTAITLSAEDREFHWGDALRLRALAQTITTPTVRDRVLERAYEHARIIGATEESSSGS